jgi:hypothetical protein
MRSILAVMAVALAVSSTAAAQAVEVAGGIGLPLPAPATTYETRFSPTFQFPDGRSGQAGQVFTLVPSRRPAVWAAVGWFPVPHAGLELRVRSRSAGLEVESGPYSYTLTFVSRQPPDYVPREITVERGDTWPHAEGRLREFGVDMVAVGRLGQRTRTHLRVSGGLALVSLGGELRPAGVTTFRLGGHSTLMPTTYEAALRFERTWTTGLALGADVHRPIAARAALVTGARVLLPAGVDASARVTAVSQGPFPLTPADAQRALAPPPLARRPWTVDLVVGVRFSS